MLHAWVPQSSSPGSHTGPDTIFQVAVSWEFWQSTTHWGRKNSPPFPNTDPLVSNLSHQLIRILYFSWGFLSGNWCLACQQTLGNYLEFFKLSFQQLRLECWSIFSYAQVSLCKLYTSPPEFCIDQWKTVWLNHKRGDGGLIWNFASAHWPYIYAANRSHARNSS